ncbi:MAG: hypothetical protein K2Q11_08920 [Burkholderiaceae bacterium]|nr:hypothetical protein [Burkholderiaceae bacterium]
MSLLPETPAVAFATPEALRRARHTKGRQPEPQALAQVLELLGQHLPEALCALERVGGGFWAGRRNPHCHGKLRSARLAMAPLRAQC